MTQCTGRIRVNEGKWYTPHEFTTHECTYCEWCLLNGCITNGCTAAEEVYESVNLDQCNCDCNKDHPRLEEYACKKHATFCFFTCDMGRCSMCNNWTSSGCFKYCNACSAFNQICHVCGEK